MSLVEPDDPPFVVAAILIVVLLGAVFLAWLEGRW